MGNGCCTVSIICHQRYQITRGSSQCSRREASIKATLKMRAGIPIVVENSGGKGHKSSRHGISSKICFLIFGHPDRCSVNNDVTNIKVTLVQCRVC